MPTVSNYTTFAAFLKQRYTNRKIEDLTNVECPLKAMMARDTELQGEATPIPMIHGNPQGIGGTVAAAQAGATNLKGKKLILTPGELDGSVSITDKIMKASKSNPGAWLSARMGEIDGLYTAFGTSLNSWIWGNGGGSIGRIGAISSNTITLLNPADVVNFEVDMICVVSANDGSDVAHVQRAGSATVTQVNRDTGEVVFDNLGLITGELVNDYIFRNGAFIGNSGLFVTHGVQSYIYANNTPPTIYSMVRTDDPQRLAGSRVPAADVAGRSYEDRLQILATYMTGRMQGKGPTHGFMHTEDWQDLAIELQSRGTRPLVDSSTKFGFQALEMVAGGRTIKIYADPFAPKGTAFLLRLENWKLHSLGEVIHAVNEDGLTLLRGSAANNYEHRVVSYPAVSCNAPGFSGRVPLTG